MNQFWPWAWSPGRSRARGGEVVAEVLPRNTHGQPLSGGCWNTEARYASPGRGHGWSLDVHRMERMATVPGVGRVAPFDASAFRWSAA